MHGQGTGSRRPPALTLSPTRGPTRDPWVVSYILQPKRVLVSTLNFGNPLRKKARKTRVLRSDGRVTTYTTLKSKRRLNVYLSDGVYLLRQVSLRQSPGTPVTQGVGTPSPLECSRLGLGHPLLGLFHTGPGFRPGPDRMTPTTFLDRLGQKYRWVGPDPHLSEEVTLTGTDVDRSPDRGRRVYAPGKGRPSEVGLGTRVEDPSGYGKEYRFRSRVRSFVVGKVSVTTRNTVLLCLPVLCPGRGLCGSWLLGSDD